MKQFSQKTIPLSYIVLVFFALATMNVINRYYYFVFFAVFLFCLKRSRKFYLDDVPLVFLFVLAVSWAIFSPSSMDSIFGILKPVAYILCYIVGASMIEDDSCYSEDELPLKLFYVMIVMVAAGSFVHYILNWITNTDSAYRNTVDIWTGTNMAATGQASFACLPLGLAIGALFCKNGLAVKIASIITIVLILGYNLVLSGRTLIVMFLAITALAFLHKLFTLKSGKIRLLFIVVAVIVLLVLLYRFDVFGIGSYIESSPMYDRFFAENSDMELNEDGRIELKLYHISNMDRFLFGGAHIREEIGYSHDIFFDTYDEAGVFAFLAIIGYLLTSMSHLVKCVKDSTLPFNFRNIVLCVYFVIYMEFMVEPILQGMPWLFATFCLIDGYVSRILHQNKMVFDGRIQEQV